MNKKKRKERRKVLSAKEIAQKHGEDTFKSLVTIPEGVFQFKIKKAGVYRFDIIPFYAGEGNFAADVGAVTYEKTFFVHWTPEGRMLICRKETAKLRCPICEYKTKLNKDPDSDADEVESLRYKKRQIFNVIDLSEKEKGIQIFELSYHLFGKMLNSKVDNSDDEDGYDDFHHPETGYTVRVVFEEKTLGKNTFYEATDIEFKTRKKQYDWEIVDEAHCLDELLTIDSYEQVEEDFFGSGDESKKRKSKERESEKIEEDEDDDDDLDDEDEENYKKMRQTNDEEDDEEDDDGNGDWDEEEDDLEAEDEEDEDDDKEDDDKEDDDDWDEDEDEEEPKKRKPRKVAKKEEPKKRKPRNSPNKK